MANKRYDEFAAGDTDPARIMLHADPSTGELKKATIPQVTGCVFSKSLMINGNNSGSNPETLGTIVIPFRYIDPIGTWVEVTYIGSFLSTTGPPIASLELNTGDPVPLNGTAAGGFRLEAWYQRVSTTHIRTERFNTRILTNAGESGQTNRAISQGTDLTIGILVTQGGANTVYIMGANVRVFNP